MLLDGGGNVCRCRTFYGPTHMNSIIEDWKKLYGKGWKNATIKTESDNKKPITEKSNYKKGAVPKKYKVKRYRNQSRDFNPNY